MEQPRFSSTIIAKLELLQTSFESIFDINQANGSTQAIQSTQSTQPIQSSSSDVNITSYNIGNTYHSHHTTYTTRYKSKEEEKKEDEDAKAILGGLIIAGVTLLGTYVIANDPYVLVWRKGLHIQIKDIQTELLEVTQTDDTVYLAKTLKECEDWLNSYNQSVKSYFFDKALIIGSGVAIGIGTFMTCNPVIIAACASGLFGTCKWIWDASGDTSKIYLSVAGKVLNNLKAVIEFSKSPKQLIDLPPSLISSYPSAPYQEVPIMPFTISQDVNYYQQQQHVNYQTQYPQSMSSSVNYQTQYPQPVSSSVNYQSSYSPYNTQIY